MMRRTTTIHGGVFSLLAACGIPTQGSSVTTTTSGQGSSSTAADGGPETGVDPTQADTSTASTTSVDESTDNTAFIPPTDGGIFDECSIFEQDCPRGSKCMGHSFDGTGGWDATRCSPVADNPGTIGDPCTVEGSPFSGLDDCELGTMCWDVDPVTLTGTCVGQCQGSEALPTCADACASCVIDSGGVPLPCLPGCDPLQSDCPEGARCIAQVDSFVCKFQEPRDLGGPGDPCYGPEMCAAGNHCADAAAVPGCDSDTGCCAPFCAVGVPGACDASPGTTCVPVFDPPDDPAWCMAWQGVGACVTE